MPLNRILLGVMKKIHRLFAGVLALAAALGLTFGMPFIASAEETELESSSVSMSFEEVEDAVLSGNLTALSIQENIDMIGEIDYDEIQDQLLSAMNQLADVQWALSTSNIVERLFLGITDPQYQLDQVNSQWNALNDQYEAIKDGSTKKTNDETQWMLRNTQKQLVMAAESLYVTEKSLEISHSSLARQEEALKRTKAEMDVRYKNGQVSQLNLAELENGATQLSSGRSTLEMNMDVLSLQLKNLIGADLGAKLILKDPALPTEEQLSSMDLEKDLKSAMAHSYELYDARKKLSDAEDKLKEEQNKFDYYERPDSAVRKQADHNWNSAQYTYQATERSFELSFRTLYAKVKDYAQVYEASKTARDTEKKNLEADRIRYSYGTISQNALRTAEDDLATAEEKVRSSGFDLAAAYRQYIHAVEDGILNGNN